MFFALQAPEKKARSASLVIVIVAASTVLRNALLRACRVKRQRKARAHFSWREQQLVRAAPHAKANDPARDTTTQVCANRPLWAQ